VILADSSIWIDHFRRARADLEALIGSGRVVTHPFVIAEVALGFLAERRKKLGLMELLWQVEVANILEVRRMIETRVLYSRGIGLIDAHLLASCLLTPGTQIWTRDTRLQNVAKALGVHAAPLLLG
jgi:predicted nucleic acid-binding protein